METLGTLETLVKLTRLPQLLLAHLVLGKS